jgi:hypothetical protein
MSTFPLVGRRADKSRCGSEGEKQMGTSAGKARKSKATKTAKQKTSCPQCDGPVLPILYGLPTKEAGEKAKRGGIVLGWMLH